MQMQNKKIEIQWLRHAGQALGFVPTLGGGVAAWQLDSCHAVNNTEVCGRFMAFMGWCEY